jgi:septal ring factor EnvC (AmiA/AmiB activator)
LVPPFLLPSTPQAPEKGDYTPWKTFSQKGWFYLSEEQRGELSYLKRVRDEQSRQLQEASRAKRRLEESLSQTKALNGRLEKDKSLLLNKTHGLAADVRDLTYENEILRITVEDLAPLVPEIKREAAPAPNSPVLAAPNSPAYSPPC